MFSIISHQGKAKWNYCEITAHDTELRIMWGKETLLIDGGSEIGVSTMEVSL